MFGKRVDAIRAKASDGFHAVVPYVMPKRTEAEISDTETFDVTELLRLIKSENEADGVHLKVFHAFCTAWARTIFLRPLLNRFIKGKYYWDRKDILLSFVAKKAFADGADEYLMTLKAKPEMTIYDISRIILGDVKTAREKSTNDLGDLMEFLRKMPRCVLTVLFLLIRFLDYFAMMPYSLMKGDPNYCTALISNLGSIGAGAPYHHLSEYGTCSIMITIGAIREEMRRMADGTEEMRSLCDVTFILDERIADGVYFVKSLKLTRWLLEHPVSLKEPISAPVPEGVY